MSRDTRSAVSILAIVPGQFYTVLRDFHRAPLEKHAQRAFEHFLAHLRPCSDFRRIAVVVQGSEPPFSRIIESSVSAEWRTSATPAVAG